MINKLLKVKLLSIPYLQKKYNIDYREAKKIFEQWKVLKRI